MLPILPNICNNYSIRLTTFHLSLIKHAFAEQRLDYRLIRMLNAYGSMTFTLKAQSLFSWFPNFCESSMLMVLRGRKVLSPNLMVVMKHLVYLVI